MKREKKNGSLPSDAAFAFVALKSATRLGEQLAHLFRQCKSTCTCLNKMGKKGAYTRKSLYTVGIAQRHPSFEQPVLSRTKGPHTDAHWGSGLHVRLLGDNLDGEGRAIATPMRARSVDVERRAADLKETMSA
jgi:hypothetical protein